MATDIFCSPGTLPGIVRKNITFQRDMILSQIRKPNLFCTPMNGYENFLNIEVVWKDDWAIELEFTVSNNGYSGVARGYDTAEHLEILAKQLEGFPRDDQSIFYEIKESSQQGNLSISFCQITTSGLVGVKVHLENEGSINCQHSKVSLELLVEPNSIDMFQKYLATLAANQEGIAKLIAR